MTDLDTIHRLKGVKDGYCNRSACLAPGATWYNHSTMKYYCKRCALDLNHYNRQDAMKLFGHDLCTPQKEVPTEA